MGFFIFLFNFLILYFSCFIFIFKRGRDIFFFEGLLNFLFNLLWVLGVVFFLNFLFFILNVRVRWFCFFSLTKIYCIKTVEVDCLPISWKSCFSDFSRSLYYNYRRGRSSNERLFIGTGKFHLLSKVILEAFNTLYEASITNIFHSSGNFLEPLVPLPKRFSPSIPYWCDSSFVCKKAEVLYIVFVPKRIELRNSGDWVFGLIDSSYNNVDLYTIKEKFLVTGRKEIVLKILKIDYDAVLRHNNGYQLKIFSQDTIFSLCSSLFSSSPITSDYEESQTQVLEKFNFCLKR